MAKKIRVEFELSPKEVKELVEFGAKGPKTLSDKELDKLSKKGVIRAADYLDTKQQVGVKKYISKIPHKYSKAAYGPKIIDKIYNKALPKVEKYKYNKSYKKIQPDKSRRSGASSSQDIPKE